MNTNTMELNLDEMETVNGGRTANHYQDGAYVWAAKRIAEGAVAGSGIHDGTHRPGGVMVTVIGAAMGAWASLCGCLTGD